NPTAGGFTGSFLELNPANTDVVTTASGVFDFHNLAAAGDLFTVTAANGNVFRFDVTSETVATSPSFEIDGAGIVNLTGFAPTDATFKLTTQNGSTFIDVSFSSTIAVPGPVVGAGLPGLIAACGGLLAFARRRRQQRG